MHLLYLLLYRPTHFFETRMSKVGLHKYVNPGQVRRATSPCKGKIQRGLIRTWAEHSLSRPGVRCLYPCVKTSPSMREDLLMRGGTIKGASARLRTAFRNWANCEIFGLLAFILVSLLHVTVNHDLPFTLHGFWNHGPHVYRHNYIDWLRCRPRPDCVTLFLIVCSYGVSMGIAAS